MVEYLPFCCPCFHQDSLELEMPCVDSTVERVTVTVAVLLAYLSCLSHAPARDYLGEDLSCVCSTAALVTVMLRDAFCALVV